MEAVRLLRLFLPSLRLNHSNLLKTVDVFCCITCFANSTCAPTLEIESVSQGTIP